MKLAISALLLVLVISCNKKSTCYQGNGDITNEVRTVDDFSHVDLSTSANVYIEHSSDYQVSVETNKNLQDYVKTEVNNGLLSLSSKKDKCIESNATVNIYIKAPSLSKISISGSGSITVLNQFNSSEFAVWSSGSGNIKVDNLISNKLETNSSGSGNIEIASTDSFGI